MQIKLLSFLVLAGITWGCKEPVPAEESPKQGAQSQNVKTVTASTRGFIPASVLQRPGNLLEMTKSELREALNANATFFNDTDDADASEKDCLIKKFEATRVAANKTTIQVSGEINSSSCPKDPGVNSQYSSVKFLILLSCDIGSFQSFNGIPIGELFESKSLGDLCPSGPGYYLENIESSTNIEYEDSEGLVKFKSQSSIGVMSRDATVCRFFVENGIRKVADGCMEFDRTRFEENGVSQTEFFRAEYSGVTAKVGGRYYASGKMKTVLNNWQGEVTFDGGRPEYKMSSSGQTSEGTITGSGLNLRSGFNILR